MASNYIYIIFIVAVGIFLGTNKSQADLAFSRNARTFETQHSTLVMKGLAHSCLTIAVIPDGLPCNPAMTPLNQKPNLGVEALLSNGYSSLENVKKLLDSKVTQELADTLFGKGKVNQIETNVDINFQSKYLNAQYTPVTIKGFLSYRFVRKTTWLSVPRNPPNGDAKGTSMSPTLISLEMLAT